MSDPDWERDFADLRESYRQKLARHLSKLEAHVRDRAHGQIPRDELESARGLTHRLKGTAGTFGFDATSAAMARIEEKLVELLEEPGPEPSRAWREIDCALTRAREDVNS